MTTTAHRRRTATATLLLALPAVLLSACGGGDDGKTGSSASASAGPSISMKTALASDDAATVACKTLLGDGTQLAKDVQWPTDPKSLTIKGQVSGDVDGVVFCGLTRMPDDDSIYVRIANTVDGAKSEKGHVTDDDSATKSHAMSLDEARNVGAVIGSIPVESLAAVQTTLDALVKRVQP